VAWIWNGLGGIVCLMLLVGAWRWWRGIRLTPRLPALGGPPATPARVSIVVAARDEAAHIEHAARSLLSQRAVDLEVIVIDDRSTDGTGTILDRLAGELPGLRVLHIDALPPGWLGKCHALHHGSQIATGEWLLFADGDVHMAPDLVARAVALGEARSAAHVALIPRISDTSIAVRPCLLQPVLGVYERGPAVNREPPSKRTFVGVGAFNLVRRSVYDAFGGHEALRLEVIDDLKLGLLVGRAGGRTLLYDATADMSVPYITSVARLFQVVEKNIFALFRFSLLLTTGASLLVVAIWLGALAGPLIAIATGAPVWWAGPVCLWALAPAEAVAARRQGWSPWWALVGPLTAPLAAAAAMNSALWGWWRGAIVWRGTAYPLRDLRRGAVR
jgi:glycosyltransferase involved in cell wall biosynthesis